MAPKYLRAILKDFRVAPSYFRAAAKPFSVMAKDGEADAPAASWSGGRPLAAFTRLNASSAIHDYLTSGI